MRVWGADHVDAAAAAGQPLVVTAGDIVTPLARERARELAVDITTGAPVVPPAPPAPPVVPPPPAPSAAVTGPRAPASSPALTQRPRPVDRGAPAPPGRWGSAGSTRGTGAGTGVQRPPQAALYRRGIPVPAGVRVPGRAREPHDGAAAQAAPAGPSTPHAPSGAGAPRDRRAGGRRGRVVVVGAGHVGVVTALRLVDADVFDEVVLVDVVEGLAAGVALDLAHSAALSGFATRVRGTTSVEDAGRADYVVVTAGRARQPGMSRSDLVGTNAAIVGDVAERVSRTSPDAVVVVVTNPLDEMTHHAWRTSGFPARRVLGMAGVLDSARFRSLVAEQSWLPQGATAADVDALALGSHGDEMVVPLSVASVVTGSGQRRPLTEVVPAERLRSVVDRTRESGAEVVALLRSGSAYLAPGSSVARTVLAMATESDELVPASVMPEGAYGITDEVHVGLPVRLGRAGVREVVELPLSPDELAALREAASRIRARLDALPAAAVPARRG